MKMIVWFSPALARTDEERLRRDLRGIALQYKLGIEFPSTVRKVTGSGCMLIVVIGVSGGTMLAQSLSASFRGLPELHRGGAEIHYTGASCSRLQLCCVAGS